MKRQAISMVEHHKCNFEQKLSVLTRAALWYGQLELDRSWRVFARAPIGPERNWTKLGLQWGRPSQCGLGEEKWSHLEVFQWASWLLTQDARQQAQAWREYASEAFLKGNKMAYALPRDAAVEFQDPQQDGLPLVGKFFSATGRTLVGALVAPRGSECGADHRTVKAPGN
eukprot:4528272-Amphidinium_carterae.2